MSTLNAQTEPWTKPSTGGFPTLEGLGLEDSILLLATLLRAQLPTAGPRRRSKLEQVAVILESEAKMGSAPMVGLRRERLRGAASWAADSVEAGASPATHGLLPLDASGAPGLQQRAIQAASLRILLAVGPF